MLPPNQLALAAFFAMRLLWRAAAFLWISPLRAALSSSVTATATSSPGAVSTCAFLRAVRRAERWARFRAMAALDLRMFFFADAIFGTDAFLHLVGAAVRNTR